LSVFREHERIAVSLLTAKFLSEDVRNSVIETGKMVDYWTTPAGYFLGVVHHQIPEDRIVCSKPEVIGETDEIA